MARCAAQGGWHKRRRRGRRKKLGEENAGRETSGAGKAFEPGCVASRTRCGGARRARRGGAWRPWGGEGGGGAWGEGTRAGYVERRLFGGSRGERAAGGGRGGGERWGHGVQAVPGPCLRRLLRPTGAPAPTPKGLGRGALFSHRPVAVCVCENPPPPCPLSLWTLLPRLPSVWVCVSPQRASSGSAQVDPSCPFCPAVSGSPS